MGVLHLGAAVYAVRWLPLSGQQQSSCCRQQHPTSQASMVHPAFLPSGCRCLQEPCLADMESLPYTSAVLKEAMRLYPPAGLTTRGTSSDIEVGPIRGETCADSTRVPCSCVMLASRHAGTVLNHSKIVSGCGLASWPSLEVSSSLLTCVQQLFAFCWMQLAV